MTWRLSNFLPQIVMILFGLLLLYIIPNQINDVPNLTIGPRFFPTAIAILIIILSVISLVSTFKKERKNVWSNKDGSNGEQREKQQITKNKGYKQVIFTFLILIAWTVILPHIGFFVTTFLVAFSLMLLIGEKSRIKMLIIATLFTLFLYLVAKYLLHLSIIQTGFLF